MGGIILLRNLVSRGNPHIRKFCKNPEKKLTRNLLMALTLGERSPKVGGAQFAIRLRNEGLHT
jgi:hypothetical protein